MSLANSARIPTLAPMASPKRREEDSGTTEGAPPTFKARVELPMETMWIQNLTLTMGLVDTSSVPTLLKMVASGRIPSEKMGTHSFTFDQIDEAYDVFNHAADNLALKVVITP